MAAMTQLTLTLDLMGTCESLADRKLKMAAMTRLSLTLDLTGISNQSEHSMGPGSHVGFPISAKDKNLVYDHPVNISAKFGSVEILKIFSLETTKPIEL
jgi:hypothetical protein